MKVLNYTGLQNLWTNIKNYITVHTPTKTSDLTNDSGFLTSTDISSKANDSEVLHKAQTETVTGEKTFKKDVKIIDLNANERPGVQFEVNGSFGTFEQAKDSLPDTSGGGIGIGTGTGFSIGGLSSLWSGWVLGDNVKLQNSMSDYVINDITFGSTNYSSVIEFNNYYKVYEETDDTQTDVRGMLRFELSPYANVEKDHEYWSNPNLNFYAMLDGSGDTILGHKSAPWSKGYISEINCSDIKFGGVISIFDVLASKANSADLATVATSGSYNDLSNKPSIPTKTSEITNDSNFVDTSNAAVASGITSAKVTDYDTHIADNDIHVTTADKNKWNNNTYVFRYSSTALTASSTNANSLLDNTDNLKVGDKVIDNSGVLFSITAIDTANSTFTVGTALIDLAQDSDVVHKSGDETITGVKTFTDANLELKSTSAEYGVSAGDSSVIFRDKNNLQTFKIYSRIFYAGVDNNLVNFYLTQKVDNTYYVSNGIQLFANTGNKNAILRPILANNNADGLSVSLGDNNRRWQSVYATNYYYGSNNVEFSTKFVTTDTTQTISGTKTFGNGTLIVDNTTGSNVHGEIKFNGSRPGYIVADNASDGVFASSESGISILLQDSNKPLHIGGYKVDSNGRVSADNTNKNPLLAITGNLVKTSILVPENDTVTTNVLRILSQIDYADGNTSKFLDVRFVQYDNANATSSIYSNADNKTTLGVSTRKWSDVLTYKVNSVEPSVLSMPSGDVSNFIDISSYFTNTGTGDTNSYTALANGWIYLRLGDISSCQVVLNDSSDRRLWGTSATGNVEQIIMPILKNTTLTTTWVTNSTVNVATARFIPCQGNV